MHTPPPRFDVKILVEKCALYVGIYSIQLEIFRTWAPTSHCMLLIGFRNYPCKSRTRQKMHPSFSLLIWYKIYPPPTFEVVFRNFIGAYYTQVIIRIRAEFASFVSDVL